MTSPDSQKRIDQNKAFQESAEIPDHKTPIIVSGLPGAMATLEAVDIAKSHKYALVPLGISSENHNWERINIEGTDVTLTPFTPERLATVADQYKGLIAVDYSKGAVNKNAELYVMAGIPFVMGSTGGDRKKLMETVQNSQTCAVIAPNMAKKIVAFMGDIEAVSLENQGLLQGCKIVLLESHQAAKVDKEGKPDTSGTMIAMVEKDGAPNGYFNVLGTPCTRDQIIMLRNPEEQLKLGVSQEHLDGHGWHFYGIYSDTLNEKIDRFYKHLEGFITTNNAFSSAEVYYGMPKQKSGLVMNPEFVGQKVRLPELLPSNTFSTHVIDRGENVGFSVYWMPGRFVGLAHNVDGRMVYVKGTEDALDFLSGKLREAEKDPKVARELKGKVFSMNDVLRAQTEKSA